MNRLHLESSAAESPAEAFVALPASIPGSSSEAPPPGSRCLLLSRDHRPAARCTIQVANDLYGVPGRSGLVGCYEAVDAAAGVALLRAAINLLRSEGVLRVLGPMNGNTWSRYRLALPGSATQPRPEVTPFLSEPRNPPGYPEHFTTAGFQACAWYESRVDENPDRQRPGAERLRQRLAARGILTRPLELRRYEAELDAIHELSLSAFARNFYYTPISLAEFRRMYLPLRPLLDAELVRMACDASGRLLAFLFAFPDPLSTGGAPRVIAKTAASHPETRRLGLGTALLDEVRQIAAGRGFRSVIHALMHVQNASVTSSCRFGSRRFRDYALYQWLPDETR